MSQLLMYSYIIGKEKLEHGVHLLLYMEAFHIIVIIVKTIITSSILISLLAIIQNCAGKMAAMTLLALP